MECPLVCRCTRYESYCWLSNFREYIKVENLSRTLVLTCHTDNNFSIIKPIRCTNFQNLLRHETLHVSGSSSAHHQEFIHFRTGPSWYCLKAVFKPVWHIPVPSVCLFSWRYNPVVLFSTALYRALASSLSRFIDHTQWRATVGRTPLDEWSIRRRDLYLTTHNIHNRRTSMPPVGFETTISAGKRP